MPNASIRHVCRGCGTRKKPTWERNSFRDSTAEVALAGVQRQRRSRSRSRKPPPVSPASATGGASQPADKEEIAARAAASATGGASQPADKEEIAARAVASTTVGASKAVGTTAPHRSQRRDVEEESNTAVRQAGRGRLRGEDDNDYLDIGTNQDRGVVNQLLDGKRLKPDSS